jgi:hypothetical protein
MEPQIVSIYIILARSDREDGELLDDLRGHVQSLNQSNSHLKTKVQFFKTLYDSESKKKTPYMHIPPRVESVSWF